MGVKLKQFTNGKKIELKELNNKTISIDAFNTLYQFLATIRGPMGEPLKNRDGEITSHLTGLFYRNINLLNANIGTYSGSYFNHKAEKMESVPSNELR